MARQSHWPALQMADSPFPLVQSYHPTTFLERGVAVAFTTPTLVGTRARPGRRGAAELIIPSPAGGRGVYVLPWSGVRELCRPTVHDQRLNQLIEGLSSVTPARIRGAGRQVATEGLAGHEALTAADTATRADREATLLTNFMLVMALLEQTEPRGTARAQAEPGEPSLEARAKRALAQVGPRLGRAPEAIAAVLEDMAPHFAPIGVGSKAAGSRIVRGLEVLCQLRADMEAWRLAHSDESGAQAEMVAKVAELTIACAQTTLERAHELTEDMLELLRRWGEEEGDVQQLVGRSEWLLDGWDQICALWASDESPIARRAVLAEMVLLVPTIPREASAWVNLPIDMDALLRFRRTVSLNEDWRTGSTVIDLVARNERLRALAA